MERVGALNERIDFYIDPSCPWAWRGSEWIREVALHVPLQISWKIFSLQLVNEGRDHPRTSFHAEGLKAARVLVRVRRNEGVTAFDELYRAIGKAVHDRGLEIDQEHVKTALVETGRNPATVVRALADPGTLDTIRREHRIAAETVGGFGVPTIVVSSGNGIFGPVLGRIPRGPEAVALWRKIRDMIDFDGFYELKRRRP